MEWKQSQSFPTLLAQSGAQAGGTIPQGVQAFKKVYGRIFGAGRASRPPYMREQPPLGPAVDRSVLLGGIQGIVSPPWKRIMDLALVLLTSPAWLLVMIFVTVWIKLVSPGPTFYRQERVGYCGKKFMLLKFRSMRVNAGTQAHEEHFAYLIAANAPMTKLDKKGDPRLIPGGRIIRALGLDEVPQIINVLYGEMSLVGPRPCTPSEFEHYQPWHRERVKVPPGITGYWQVNGKNNTTFSEMIAMDVFYAEHISLCLDFEILLKTTSTIAAQVLETHLKHHCWS